MSEGETSSDAMHRFIDLCCQAFETLRQNWTLILLFLCHLNPSKIPKLNSESIRFVYDRLSPSMNYAQSITRFTDLIVESLNCTWTRWNGLIHKMAVSVISTSGMNTVVTTPNILFQTTNLSKSHDQTIQSIEVVKCEKRSQPQKYYLYKFEVKRKNQSTFHYRTYSEFYEFSERLKTIYPLIGLNLQYSQRIEDKVLAQRRTSDVNAFLNHLYQLTNCVFEVRTRLE